MSSKIENQPECLNFRLLLREYFGLSDHQFAMEQESKIVLPETLESVFTERLQQFLKSDKQILFVPVPGFPGVGKSTASWAFAPALDDAGIESNEVQLDKFFNWIGEDRGEKMLASPEAFREGFYDENLIYRYLSQIVVKHPNQTARVEGTYQKIKDVRSKDGVEEITIPEGKLVLLVDGVNAGYHVQQIADAPWVDVASYFVFTDPANSLLRATLRDIKNDKTKSIESVLFNRIREYQLLWRWMRDEMQWADHIVVNIDGPQILARQIREVKKMLNINGEALVQSIQNTTDQFWAQREKIQKKVHRVLDTHFVHKLISRTRQGVGQGLTDAEILGHLETTQGGKAFDIQEAQNQLFYAPDAELLQKIVYHQLFSLAMKKGVKFPSFEKYRAGAEKAALEMSSHIGDDISNSEQLHHELEEQLDHIMAS